MIKKLAIVIGIAALAWILSVGWQVGSAELANIELRDDMKGMASQLAAHIGFSPAKSDEDFRAAVVREGQGYGIDLDPDQVTVERTVLGTGRRSIWRLTIAYRFT